MTAQPETRHAPLALWRMAQAFLNVLNNLFGAPSDIARAPIMAREAHKQLASWLSVAEAIMRRLLLIEAAALAPAVAPQRVRAPRARIRRQVEFWPDKPEDWRVSFRCFPSRAAVRQAHRNAEPGAAGSVSATLSLSKGDAPRFRDAWSLALRYEALIRVFNAPQRCARRLARSLQAKPRRLSQLLPAPREYTQRVDNADDLTRRAVGAWEERPDTS